MVVANAVPCKPYIHQVGYNHDPSDTVDLLTAWPLWLYDCDLCVCNFGGPGRALADVCWLCVKLI